MNISTALNIWERAIKEEIGLVVKMESQEEMEIVKAVLYKARQLAKNEEYENYMICKPGDDPTELILVKKTVELD